MKFNSGTNCENKLKFLELEKHPFFEMKQSFKNSIHFKELLSTYTQMTCKTNNSQKHNEVNRICQTF